jgi:hypothetical protein
LSKLVDISQISFDSDFVFYTNTVFLTIFKLIIIDIFHELWCLIFKKFSYKIISLYSLIILNSNLLNQSNFSFFLIKIFQIFFLMNEGFSPFKTSKRFNFHVRAYFDSSISVSSLIFVTSEIKWILKCNIFYKVHSDSLLKKYSFGSLSNQIFIQVILLKQIHSLIK